MQVRFGLLLVGLVAAGLLAGGCDTARPAAGKSTSTTHVARRHPPANTSATTNSDEAIIDAHAHYAAAVAAEADDDRTTALDEYYQAALKDPTNEGLLLEVSRRFIEARQSERALSLLTNVTQNAHAPGSIFAVMGSIYAQLGQYDLGAEADRQAIQRAPGLLAGYQNLYLTQMHAHQQAAAVRVLDDAANVPGSDAEFLIGLAELYADAGLQIPGEARSAKARALSVLERARRLHPADPVTRLRMADAFSANGGDDVAVQLYKSTLDDLQEPFLRQGVRAKLADIYLNRHDDKDASEQFQAIIREDPTNPKAYYLLGQMALDADHYKDAAENLSKAILLDPDNPEYEHAYYDLALAQSNEDQTPQALATLEKARRKFAPNFTMEYVSALVYSHDKQYAEALRHFTTAEIIIQATSPKDLNDLHFFYFQFGATAERQGDYAQAEKHFEKCLQLAPNFAEALNYLGFMWADHGQNLDRARDLIEKAVNAEPKNAAYLDSMGWVLYKLNRPKEALPYMLKALQYSEEEDATIYDHVGDIYAALGQKDKARDAWRKSLSLEANDTVRKKLEPDAK